MVLPGSIWGCKSNIVCFALKCQSVSIIIQNKEWSSRIGLNVLVPGKERKKRNMRESGWGRLVLLILWLVMFINKRGMGGCIGVGVWRYFVLAHSFLYTHYSVANGGERGERERGSGGESESDYSSINPAKPHVKQLSRCACIRAWLCVEMLCRLGAINFIFVCDYHVTSEKRNQHWFAEPRWCVRYECG